MRRKSLQAFMVLFALVVPLILVAVAHGATLGVVALADASAPARPGARKWKDAQGHVIKRVASNGVMTLLTYDESGHVIRIDGMKERVSHSRSDETVPPGGVEWTHCFNRYPNGGNFEYDDEGNIVSSLDGGEEAETPAGVER